MGEGVSWGARAFGAVTCLMVGVVACSATEEPEAPKDYRPRFTDVGIGDDGQIFAVSDDGLFSSSKDGIVWDRGAAPREPAWNRVFYGGNPRTWLTVGDSARYSVCNGTGFGCRNSDGVAGGPNFRAGAVCPGRYFVGGVKGALITSTNAESWTGVAGMSADDLVGLACTAKVTVVVSNNDAMYVAPANTANFKRLTGAGKACAVAVSEQGMFVTVTLDGTVSTSSDGETWTVTARAQWSLVEDCDIAWGNGTFVVVTSAGDIVASADAKTWTKVDYGAPLRLGGCGMSAQGRLLAAGDGGVVIDANCGGGTCSDPKRREVLVPSPKGTKSPPPSSGSSSGTSSGSSGGACGNCTSDADCAGVASRHGCAGAVCGPDNLCHCCLATCSGGGSNCRCFTCAEGCPSQSSCMGASKLCGTEMAGRTCE